MVLSVTCETQKWQSLIITIHIISLHGFWQTNALKYQSTDIHAPNERLKIVCISLVLFSPLSLSPAAVLLGLPATPHVISEIIIIIPGSRTAAPSFIFLRRRNDGQEQNHHWPHAITIPIQYYTPLKGGKLKAKNCSSSSRTASLRLVQCYNTNSYANKRGVELNCARVGVTEEGSSIWSRRVFVIFGQFSRFRQNAFIGNCILTFLCALALIVLNKGLYTRTKLPHYHLLGSLSNPNPTTILPPSRKSERAALNNAVCCCCPGRNAQGTEEHSESNASSRRQAAAEDQSQQHLYVYAPLDGSVVSLSRAAEVIGRRRRIFRVQVTLKYQYCTQVHRNHVFRLIAVHN